MTLFDEIRVGPEPPRRLPRDKRKPPRTVGETQTGDTFDHEGQRWIRRGLLCRPQQPDGTEGEPRKLPDDGQVTAVELTP